MEFKNVSQEYLPFELHPQLKKDTDRICSLGLSEVLLSKELIGPWIILVPRVLDATEIFKLTNEQQQALLQESSIISKLLVSCFDAEKINIGAIGNMVPQLHIHHVARFKSDYIWPKPIWGNTNQKLRNNIEQQKLIALLNKNLKIHSEYKA